MSDHDDLALFRDELTTAIQGLADTSTWLGERLAAGDLQMPSPGPPRISPSSARWSGAG
jgi:hypothetical protein